MMFINMWIDTDGKDGNINSNISTILLFNNFVEMLIYVQKEKENSETIVYKVVVNYVVKLLLEDV